MPESLGGQLADALGEVLQRSSRARIYGDLTQGLDPAIDEATYPVISALGRSGARTAAQLAAEVGIDRSVVSRHGDRLEAHGLIRREPDPTDRRGTLLTLTEDGAQQVAVMRTRLHTALDKYLATWPPDQARAFVDNFIRFVTEGPFGTPA
jgi:DNA-binding MarR family transcriptional regulator